MLFGLRYSTPPLYDRWTAISIIARDSHFDYVTWEINALAVKAHQTLYGMHPYMEERDRSQYVRDYMADIAEAQWLEGQVTAVYTDPTIEDPAAASEALRVQRDQLRDDLRRRQPLAESILEGQVAAILAEQGFGVYGQILPPVSAHFTQMPNLLVVSPRDKISFDIAINLNHMTVDQQAALEDAIEREHDVSALIVPLGGIALYPAMILETASIPYAAEVIAHEWLHHYLIAFPLGYTYDMAGEARIINETTASVFGKEIGQMVIARYYPELVPPPPAPPEVPETSPTRSTAQQAPQFDYGAEMHATRVRVDELLAEGRVEAAERYMESRRVEFVEHGYGLRKLNQAFFAFYGGYQSPGSGVGGSDPIGPAIQALRDSSPSVHEWIVTMRGITTRAQLLATRDARIPAEAAQAE